MAERFETPAVTATLDMVTGVGQMPPLPTVLEQLFDRLDRFDERVPLEVLQAELSSVSLSREDVEELCCFDDCQYRRNRVRLGSCYEALLLCWRSGQESPIHDHAGSNCGFKILDGAATETVYRLNESGLAVPGESEQMNSGLVCATQDEDIHRVSNLQGQDLVTLHIYSPQLVGHHLYEAA